METQRYQLLEAVCMQRKKFFAPNENQEDKRLDHAHIFVNVSLYHDY